MTITSEEYFPSVSVIINTDARVKSLSNCLESLRYLRYPNFEVVVVPGPTRDGTHELCQAFGDRIKFAECPVRNLSTSRNISIRISSGELLCFLDDDAIPEPEWLDDVVSAFRDPEIAVAGGFLHDHTGKEYQWKFGTLDRYGTADTRWTRPAPEFNFPNSFNFPSVIGANSAFRRNAIVEVGGFDEEYEYFLDESDIILRLIDAGWKVAQLDKGFVHHKFMPSHIRNSARVLTSWYSVIKNKAYFSLVNGREHFSIDNARATIESAIDEFRNHVRWAINERLLDPIYLDKFEDEIIRAKHDGFARGIEGRRKLAGKDALKGNGDFRRFPSCLEGSEQRCYVFLSRTYPPGSMGGIGRYVHQLSQEIAKIGHQVHVLTTGTGHDRVDFEHGVWVHRICVRESRPPEDMRVPTNLWNYSNTMFEEAVAIATRRPITCIFAPIWDIEGIAFLVQKSFKVVTTLHTTLSSYLDANLDKLSDNSFMDEFAKPVLDLEKRLMVESNGILANSKAIVEEIERAYGIHFNKYKLRVVPHGMSDWTKLPFASPPPLPQDSIRICFIGRLEARKGGDVFLGIVPTLIDKYEHVHIDIVGNDEIRNFHGTTIRSIFETEHPSFACHSRITFHGEVDEEQLRGFYSAADIIVAPSRFESFGLVHLEAMMYGKPVIGCNVGGMVEVIDDGVTGILAIPGDSTSLQNCIEKMIEDVDLRARLGENARRRYKENFSAYQMAEQIVSALESICL